MQYIFELFQSLLESSCEPLSFAVFVPDWRDPPTTTLVRLERSRFCRRKFVVNAHEHEYRHGFQHSLPPRDVSVKAAHGTLVVFLQNEAGYARWTPTPERVKELRLAFLPPDRHAPPTLDSHSTDPRRNNHHVWRHQSCLLQWISCNML